MFRESAPILEILGRDCVYRSKFQPEQESWVLIEFDGSVEGSKRTTVQGQVKSVQPDAFEANAYRIYGQLESAQGLKIVPPAQPPKTTTPAAPTAPVAQNPVARPRAAPARRAEAVRMPKEAFAEPINRAKPDLSVAKPLVIESPLGKAAAPVTREVSAPRPQADAPGWSREAATASVALEVKEQL